jgi:hypothetical protein
MLRYLPAIAMTAHSNDWRRTDTNIYLALAHLDLHLARPTRTLYQLKRLGFVLRGQLQQGREKVFAVPSYAQDLGVGHDAGRGSALL